MGDRLLQIVKQTGIFIVCAQMILHFKPAECYEKYIKLLIGIMVLAQLIAAASAVFGREGGNFFDGRVDYYKELLAESMEGADMEKAEALLEKMTMEEVQARINQMREEQTAALQQSEAGRQDAAAQQSGVALESGPAQGETDTRQPVEEIDIEIDRIEVKTSD
ncbi:MAG: stage III sporulation protein AF [Lachnospiraceae bacterium]|nr:stage III sporulation protein AF [Lachnospiraceae bacterium]